MITYLRILFQADWQRVISCRVIQCMGNGTNRQQLLTIGKQESLENIYLMFEECFKILLSTSKAKKSMNQHHSKERINTLMQSFISNGKYDWNIEIYEKFKKHFLPYFPQIEELSRQQFYEVLLSNCGFDIKQIKSKRSTFKGYFYGNALEDIKVKMPDTFVDNITVQHDMLNVSILEQSTLENTYIPLIVQNRQKKRPMNKNTFQQTKFEFDKKSNKINQQQQEIELEEFQSIEKQTKQYEQRIKRIQRSSLLLPETVFIERLSKQNANKMQGLVVFYRKLEHSLEQILFSNNILSCPAKHFILSFEEKIKKKRVKGKLPKQILTGANQQARKTRKRRQTNNHLVLQQIRCFLQSYTEFIWVFLEFDKMQNTILEFIVQPYLVYGCIFKALWKFFDWVALNGFEYEEYLLETYLKEKQITDRKGKKIDEETAKKMYKYLEGLKNEYNPQHYLRKIVTFYRQVSLISQNADELLSNCQYILQNFIRSFGTINMFRMKGIIEKLLRLQSSEVCGGQIGYCWATWTILLEIFRQKASYKYGNLIINLNYSQENEEGQKTLIK